MKFSGVVPKRATKLSAGYDLISTETIVLAPYGAAWIPTGTFVKLDSNQVGLLRPRSSLHGKNLLSAEGTIDADYSGEIRGFIRNLDPCNSFTINAGDRIAQLVITNYCIAVDEETPTEERVGGFGSTDKGG